MEVETLDRNQLEMAAEVIYMSQATETKISVNVTFSVVS